MCVGVLFMWLQLIAGVWGSGAWQWREYKIVNFWGYLKTVFTVLHGGNFRYTWREAVEIEFGMGYFDHMLKFPHLGQLFWNLNLNCKKNKISFGKNKLKKKKLKRKVA